MPLDGTAFSRWERRFASFAEGQAPCELVPIGGGLPVPFVHDERRIEAIETEAGALDRSVLVAMVQTRLEPASQYTHDGETWTVTSCEPDRMGGVSWRYRAELVSHVR